MKKQALVFTAVFLGTIFAFPHRGAPSTESASSFSAYEPDTGPAPGRRKPFGRKAAPEREAKPGTARNFSAGPDAETAWHEGILRIKVKSGVRESLAVADAAGIKTFGVSTLDVLNRRFRATRIRPVFPTDPRHAARHREWGLDRWFEIRLDAADHLPAAVAAYRADGNVKIAEPIYRKQLHWLPDDPRFGEQWHYRNTGQTGGTPGADIRLEEAWEIERGDPSVIVQVVDSGIDLNHPDLIPNLWVNPDPDPDRNDIHGWNFADQNDNIQDTHGHGTHVAGTVAAVSNNALGVAGVAGGSGTGDGVRIMVARAFGDDANDGFAEAIVYGADNGAVISQNSWGYTTPGVFEQAVLDAIDYFISNAGDYPGAPMRGGIFVNSAGNANSSADYYPGFYPPALAVAATTHNDHRAWYSNYGDWIDIAAPGGETTDQNRVLIDGGRQGVLSTVIGDYAFYQGTSMAAPHVSGVAALIASRYPGRTADFVETLLVGSADGIDALNPDYFGLLGAGRLNAHRALTLTLLVTPGPGFVSSGVRGGPFTPASQTYTLTNVSGAELNWTAEMSESWAEVSPGGGTLAPDGEIAIEISLTADADALPAGIHTDTLKVTDTTSGAEFERAVRLIANPSLCEAVDNCDLGWFSWGHAQWFGQLEESYDGVDAAQSGEITHNRETWLETVAEGPGALYFWWKVSSEANYDWLEFHLGEAGQDAVLQDRISGEVDWREEAYELPAGFQQLQWVYTKDGSVSLGRDCGWLDQVRIDSLLLQPLDEFFARGDQGGPFSPASRIYTLKNLSGDPLDWTAEASEAWVEVSPENGTLAAGAETTITAGFTAGAETLTPGAYSAVLTVINTTSGQEYELELSLRVEVELCEALDNCDLVWTTGGHAEWFGQVEESHDGVDAAQSGEIAHNQKSWLETGVEGPGILSFWWKVSSELGWDWLDFYLNGDLTAWISGETDWEEMVFELGEGTNTLYWEYIKDESISLGRDRGWVDRVVFQFNPLSVPDQDFFSRGLVGGPFGPAAKTYRLKNVGAEPLDWSAAVSETWLEVSPAGGTLPASGEVDVIVSLTADSLPLGLYSGIVEFSNLSEGITVERTARLIVEAPLLHDNGPIVTHPGGGADGADVSVLQTNLEMDTFGFGHQIAAGNRIADDFTISDPGGWQVETVTFLAYQSGSGLDSPITGIYLQIWDGRPGDTGSSVVFGDLVTDRMDYSLWSGIYRTRHDQMANTLRPVMSAVAVVDRHLPPGTYWLDWSLAGSGAITGPWAPPITILGQTTTGNARQFTGGAWSDARDGGTNTPQGFPFVIRGTVLPPPPPTPSVTATPSPAPTPEPAPSPTPYGEYLSWYLPAGATGIEGYDFDTYILIVNPNPIDARVEITYLDSDGPILIRERQVPANSRYTERINDQVGNGREAVSTIIRSLNGVSVVCERAMYWSRGDERWLDGHNTTGIPRAAQGWYLPEGATHIFDQFVHILNPGPDPAAVTVKLSAPGGFSVQTSAALAARTNWTVKANNVAGSRDQLFTIVSSDRPVAVDRTMYWPREDWWGGHSSRGITSPSGVWYLAEGATHIFDHYILVLNLSPAETALVELKLHPAGRPPHPLQFELAPETRRTFKVNDLIGSAEGVSAAVSSLAGGLLGVERAMYWDAEGRQWEGGQGSVGGSPAMLWYFAEGATHIFEQYLLVFNPDPDRESRVLFTFYLADGEKITRKAMVAPLSRFTLKASDVIGRVGQAAATVQTLNSVPVVAERSMYWPVGPAAGFRSGHSTLGVPWPAEIQ